MKPTPDQISAAATWANANRQEFINLALGDRMNWAAVAEGMLTAAFNVGELHVPQSNPTLQGVKREDGSYDC